MPPKKGSTYKCSRCGQPKAGHTCTAIATTTPPSPPPAQEANVLAAVRRQAIEEQRRMLGELSRAEQALVAAQTELQRSAGALKRVTSQRNAALGNSKELATRAVAGGLQREAEQAGSREAAGELKKCRDALRAAEAGQRSARAELQARKQQDIDTNAALQKRLTDRNVAKAEVLREQRERKEWQTKAERAILPAVLAEAERATAAAEARADAQAIEVGQLTARLGELEHAARDAQQARKQLEELQAQTTPAALQRKGKRAMVEPQRGEQEGRRLLAAAEEQTAAALRAKAAAESSAAESAASLQTLKQQMVDLRRANVDGHIKNARAIAAEAKVRAPDAELRQLQQERKLCQDKVAQMRSEIRVITSSLGAERLGRAQSHQRHTDSMSQLNADLLDAAPPVLLQHAPVKPADGSIRVATWNLKDCDALKCSSQQFRQTIARAITEHHVDIITLIEIQIGSADPPGTADHIVSLICAAVNAAAGGDEFAAAQADRIGQALGGRDCAAFLYRKSRVTSIDVATEIIKAGAKPALSLALKYISQLRQCAKAQYWQGANRELLESLGLMRGERKQDSVLWKLCSASIPGVLSSAAAWTPAETKRQLKFTEGSDPLFDFNALKWMVCHLCGVDATTESLMHARGFRAKECYVVLLLEASRRIAIGEPLGDVLQQWQEASLPSVAPEAGKNVVRARIAVLRHLLADFDWSLLLSLWRRSEPQRLEQMADYSKTALIDLSSGDRGKDGLCATFRVAGTGFELSLVAVHLKAMEPEVAKAQLDKLVRSLRPALAKDDVFVLGDFNLDLIGTSDGFARTASRRQDVLRPQIKAFTNVGNQSDDGARLEATKAYDNILASNEKLAGRCHGGAVMHEESMLITADLHNMATRSALCLDRLTGEVALTSPTWRLLSDHRMVWVDVDIAARTSARSPQRAGGAAARPPPQTPPCDRARLLQIREEAQTTPAREVAAYVEQHGERDVRGQQVREESLRVIYCNLKLRKAGLAAIQADIDAERRKLGE